MINCINIASVGEKDREEVIAYVLEARKQLFPMLNHKTIPTDLQYFKTTYINNSLGAFLQARTAEGTLIGTIGMIPYDHRFRYLSFREQRIVEVARLYVDPAYRNLGLGSRLVQELKKTGHRQAVDGWYLHTHPFLTGAYNFWLKQGFHLILSCEDAGFETLHMSLDCTIINAKQAITMFTKSAQ